MIQSKPAMEGKDIYLPEPAKLLKVEPLTRQEAFFEFTLLSGRDLGHLPGQFVELSVPGIGEAPISVSSSPTVRGYFEMVIRRAGNVTTALHRMEPGSILGVRGPFGTHFPVDTVMKGKDVLFICGGIGLVPVRSAIQYVLHHRADYGRVMIVIGTKTPADRLFAEEMEKWRKHKQVTLLETVDRRDETWTGAEGVITRLLPLVQVDPPKTIAVICGPPIMYKFVVVELIKMKVPDESIFLSFERHMKCGVGKCGHCQINGIYVCQDGPVFNFTDVREVEEAI
ncbi:MAG: FAD/NAD(P)-binding protein [Verrucomicrobia bacterium]|nr:FAD/NAD(P)-binding protein [Verrucomicrobiota bacterium]MBU1909027.1 FAD/NAD(P)-binding protein [Verrucomicrobiota bacterium]